MWYIQFNKLFTSQFGNKKKTYFVKTYTNECVSAAKIIHECRPCVANLIEDFFTSSIAATHSMLFLLSDKDFAVNEPLYDHVHLWTSAELFLIHSIAEHFMHLWGFVQAINE